METLNNTTTEAEVAEVVDDKPQVINADLRKFNRSEQMVKKAIAALKGITTITVKAECDSALATLKEAKTVENAIEAKRKELVKPFNDAVKKINDYAKNLVKDLPASIEDVKKLVLKFEKDEQEKVARERVAKRISQLTSLGFEQTETGFQYGTVFTTPKWMVENLDDDTWVKLLTDAQTAIETDRQAQLNKKKEELEDMVFLGGDDDVDAVKSEIQELESKPAAAITSFTSSAPATKVKGSTKRWAFEITDAAQVPREYLMVDEKKIREAVTNGERIIPGVRIYQSESLTIR